MSVRIEQRGDDLLMIGCHDKPVAKIEAEGVRIQSKHGSDKCRPLITWAEIERAKGDYFARLKT